MDTDLNINQVSEIIGYKKASSFSDAFKKNTGGFQILPKAKQPTITNVYRAAAQTMLNMLTQTIMAHGRQTPKHPSIVLNVESSYLDHL